MQQQQRSGVQQQRRAPGSSSGERRAAAATESSLVQARTSSFKANIDPQPPSTVVEMARQQSGDQVRSPQRVGGHGVRPPRNLGLARACSMFSRVLFSFLSPFPLNCLRVCGLSLPFFLSPSLSHHLSLPPSMRGSGRVGRWRGGFSIFEKGWECMRHVHACALGLGGTEMSLPTAHNGPTH